MGFLGGLAVKGSGAVTTVVEVDTSPQKLLHALGTAKKRDPKTYLLNWKNHTGLAKETWETKM